MNEEEDNNDKTIDRQQQKRQNIDESKQIAKTLDSSEAKIQTPHSTQQQIVPVLEEDFSISKQTSIKEAKIEKRIATKTKTVKIPITYEELYINGKKLKSVEEPRILSALKDKISNITNSGSSDTSVDQSISKKNKIENRGEQVPLFSSSDDDAVTSEKEKEKEKEKVIPIYEEQFEIVKKVAKVAELVITKRRITEKKVIDIDLRGEQVKIKYPDGSSQKL
jgi:stress response protein YsnF